VLNEAAGLPALLADLSRLRAAGVELIVVDGGSEDATPELAAAADRFATAPRGRARQMNFGATLARGEVLLFLHADTRLPADAVAAIGGAIASGKLWGRFDVDIAGRSVWLPVIAALMNLRSRLTGIATGDQGIFVRSDVFARLGGYADIPLMEDIELCGRLRGLSRPACLRQQVITSGRRWEKGGVWRTVFLMWSLRLRYFLGADPRQLAEDYGYGTQRDTAARAP
jgi:rSAM/selenodomain-associated transferase 2